MEKRNIKNLSIKEISELVAGLGEKRHRQTQILQWLYQKGVTGFSEMTNLPLGLRRRLEEKFSIPSLHVLDSVQSKEDTSQKFLLECGDGSLVEAVLMESSGHQTICISTQVGCPLECSFCRTGMYGFERNLGSDEILNQILFFKKGHLSPRRRFNIVFMGMGEPLLNMENVGRAIEIVNATEAFALREKRLTVSTIGFPGKIMQLAESHLRFGLAVSLNATTENVRKSIMPQSGDINETLAAAEQFARAKGNRVTLEYVLLAGINDDPEDARRLAALTAGRPFKINIIPYNEWDGCRFRGTSERRINEFVKLLLPKAPAVTIRRSRGKDIGAACGQLRIRKKDEIK